MGSVILQSSRRCGKKTAYERELLVMAAKAAGIAHDGVGYLSPTGGPMNWNPRDDDGDCARLEAAVGIDLTWYHMGVVATHYMSDTIFREPYGHHGGDRQAARRRASLLVAAAVGRGMP